METKQTTMTPLNTLEWRQKRAQVIIIPNIIKCQKSLYELLTR